MKLLRWYRELEWPHRLILIITALFLLLKIGEWRGVVPPPEPLCPCR